MTGLRRNCLVAATAIFATGIVASHGLTQQQLAEQEALVEPSLAVDSGLQLARRQIAAKDLLGALGTLGQILLANPSAIPPRLLYASLLCQLDDRQGAEVEISLMPVSAMSDPLWPQVADACGPTGRPGTAAPEAAAMSGRNFHCRGTRRWSRWRWRASSPRPSPRSQMRWGSMRPFATM